MGFLSDIFNKVKEFSRDAIKIVAPVAGAIIGGPAGFAAGTALAIAVQKTPSGGAAPTAPPAAPLMPQAGLTSPQPVTIMGPAPVPPVTVPGGFAGLFSGAGGMTPLLLIGGVVLAVVLFSGR